MVRKEVTVTAAIIHGAFVPSLFGQSLQSLTHLSQASPLGEIVLAGACSFHGDGRSPRGNKRSQWLLRPSSASFSSMNISLSKASHMVTPDTNEIGRNCKSQGKRKGEDLRTISHTQHLVLPVLQGLSTINRENRIRVPQIPRKSK